MGLITGLLTLPLAPVRGTVWLAERIQEQAEREYYDESAIRAGLQEIEEARAAGEVDERELDDDGGRADRAAARDPRPRGGGMADGRIG